MPTTLCFDFGNTRLKCAVFTNGSLQEVLLLHEELMQEVKRLLQQYQPQKTILSSVINHDIAVEQYLAAHTVFHKLNHRSKLPVTIPAGKPETVGADRLALVSAAVNLFPKQHNLVIALGSCITFNFVNNRHEFLGGSISPGLEMRLKAMHQFTAKLPLVEPDTNFPLIGYDTKTNLLSGAIMGMRTEIDGIINAYRERYCNFNVHLTGGDIGLFAPHLKNKLFADPYLIYKGIYAICELNS